MMPCTESGISRVMQWLGNRQVQYINKNYWKTGTLWEGRHKASLIDAEQYLPTCYRSIEMKSVRSNKVDHSGCHATGSPASIVKDHDVFLRIASTLEERLYRYRALFRTGLDARDVHNVLKAVAFSVPLGNNLFKERIEATLGKSVGYIPRGRPKQG
jgi:putative transposase